MSENPRLSRQTLAVLAEFLHEPGEWRYGYGLLKATGTQAGTLYPILQRLADLHWLETRWEERPAGGRPPRHLYRLTAHGVRGAQAMRERAAARGWSSGAIAPEGAG